MELFLYVIYLEIVICNYFEIILTL